MNTEDSLIEMFQLLEKHGVYASEQFFDDIKSLVKTDIKKFIKDFTKNFIRNDLKKYKKTKDLVRPPHKIKD